MVDDSARDLAHAEGTEDDTTAIGPELVIITGMSGAGRSQAIHTFEDLGFFCIDNLPPSFIPQIVELTTLPGSRVRRVAVVCDVRGMEFFDELAGELQRLEDEGIPFRLLFLEADEATLVRRFKETRRRHPLADAGSIVEGIEAEREALCDIRGRADIVVDTSEMSAQQLRDAVRDEFFAGDVRGSLAITVISFGFKYGVPIDADIVMDVRFLPNPYYEADLRDLTGHERPVQEYVLGRPEAREFLEHWFDLLGMLAPQYLMEGKSHLTVALGCTGGMHRSVVLAEETALFLGGQGFRVAVSHRDLGKDRARR